MIYIIIDDLDKTKVRTTFNKCLKTDIYTPPMEKIIYLPTVILTIGNGTILRVFGTKLFKRFTKTTSDFKLFVTRSHCSLK